MITQQIQAMPKLLRQVGGIDWGFFSEQETRLHLQSLGAVKEYKVWLECGGSRCFEDAEPRGNVLPPKIRRELYAATIQNRYPVENYWVAQQIKLGRLLVVVDPGRYVATLKMYPGTHNELVRQVDVSTLAKFPDGGKAYLKHYVLDGSLPALRFGTHLPEGEQYDLYLPGLLWTGDR
jgi:hypothetical protein